MNRVPFIVLAAGASERMGRCKLILPWGGGLLIDPALRLAATLAPNRALVVLRPNPDPVLLRSVRAHGLSPVEAVDAAQGQSESLKAGLRVVMARWPLSPGAMVLLGDHPLLSLNAALRVLRDFAEHPTCAVAAAFEGRRGHPVLVPRDAFEPIFGLSGDTGARSVLHQFALRLVETDDSATQDVDTPEAYTALLPRATQAKSPSVPGAFLPSSPPAQHPGFSRPLAWLNPIPHLPAADAFPTESPRNLAPDENACLELLHRRGSWPNILAHSRRVATLAVAMAERAVAVRGLRSPDNPGGVPGDLVETTRASGLLHDVAKTWCIRNGGSHAHVGASWVIADTGNFRVAQAVMHHVEWPWDLPEDVCVPALFVNYADRRVMHDAYVTVPERYADLLVRYGLTAASLESINGSHAQALKLEHALCAQLEFPLHACTVIGGRLVSGA